MQMRQKPDLRTSDQALHSWNVSPKQAIEIQQKLRSRVKIQPLDHEVRTVAGADTSFNLGSPEGYAGFIVFDMKTLAPIDRSYATGALTFPYIPGLLSFREIPLLMEAWKKLRTKPDLVILDGQGIAHPRHLGIASHFGVLAEIPTVGCAKSRLVGLYMEPANQAGAHTDLIYQGERVGLVCRTRKDVSPVFVSPGHLTDFSDLPKLIKRLGGGYRIPEPTRLAHLYVNELRRKFTHGKGIALPTGTSPATQVKKAFNFYQVLVRVRQATLPFPKATLFELARRGFTGLFQQLLACVISIRTRDEVSLPAAIALFKLANTPEDILKKKVTEIDQVIEASTFHLQKSFRILEIARITQEEYGSQLPCDRGVIESLPGIGPKCANLALGISCGIPGIAVDVHVFRVTRRWGLTKAPTPEKAAVELESKLPRENWIELNALLVPFGKHICTRLLPQCSKCPVLDMCRQVGVKKHR